MRHSEPVTVAGFLGQSRWKRAIATGDPGTSDMARWCLSRPFHAYAQKQRQSPGRGSRKATFAKEDSELRGEKDASCSSATMCFFEGILEVVMCAHQSSDIFSANPVNMRQYRQSCVKICQNSQIAWAKLLGLFDRLLSCGRSPAVLRNRGSRPQSAQPAKRQRRRLPIPTSKTA